MYDIQCDYKNSRNINYNRWSKHNKVELLIKDLVAGIESRKKSGYITNMKVLVLDLYHSYLTDPEQFIAYYRDKNHYDFKKRHKAEDRYVTNPHISYEYMVGSGDLLISHKLVANKRGQNFYDELEGVHGFLSRMRATPKLVKLWSQYGWNANMIEQWKQDKDLEVIILKDKPYEQKKGKKTFKIKELLNYRETNDTKRMSKVIHSYNQFMDRTHIDCDAFCISDEDRAELIKKLGSYKKKEQVIRLLLGSKHVYRVFNNGDKTFSQGGRYYGAWWIGCPGDLRKYITLNGEQTVELDYSGIHIHLLYALKGINYAVLGQDAYTLDDGIPDRDLNKLILLTAINADNTVKKTSARDSVYDQLRKKGSLRKYNLRKKEPIAKKLDLLKKKHEPIAEFIASGMGLKLQYYDSSIIEKVLEYATGRNIPILTVHDSVICQERHADLIRDKMWTFFTDLLKERLGITVRYTKYSPTARTVLRGQIWKQGDYKIPSGLWINKQPGPVGIERATVTDWLRTDDLIKIKKDARSNRCTGACNSSKKIKRFLRTIKIRLIKDGTGNKLEIRD